MEVKVYGIIVKQRYFVNWDWEDNDYEDIYHNTEKYIKLDQDTVDCKEINLDEIEKVNKAYRIVKSEYIPSENAVIHFTDCVLEVIPADTNQWEEKVTYAKQESKRILDLRVLKIEGREVHNSRKWYKFWN